MIGRYPLLFAGALLVICSFAETATAQLSDFRVETDVLVPNEPKPVQQTLTLFKNGVAYDFSRDEPDQITMVDPIRMRIVLLDAERKVQTQVDLSGLNALMDSARNQAATTGLSIYLEDARTVGFDADTKKVTVGAKVLRYEATLQEPREAKMAAHFAKFADASAYLNAWRAASPPPFARIALNQAIAEQTALPDEITRTTFIRDKDQVVGEHVVKCRLHSNWRLSKDDELQIQEIGKMLVNFATLSNAEYYQPPQVATGQANAPK